MALPATAGAVLQLGWLLALLAARALAGQGQQPQRWAAAAQLQQQGKQIGRKDFAPGASAIDVLGIPLLQRVRANSRAWDLSLNELAALLDQQDDLVVDLTAEALLYTCAGMLPGDAADPADASNDTTAALLAAGASLPPAPAPDPTLSAGQAFTLHSRAGAAMVIYLSFVGVRQAGANWNSYNGGVAITPPVYDTDGDPRSWSASELGDVVSVWRSVAEDYAPFDVDVTTEDPGDSALNNRGAWVAIGGNWTEWYKISAGGVAFVNSFGVAESMPAFVFARSLGNNPKFVAEAASHEVGHTLGLFHDGKTDGTEYYSGHNNWAPIMGTSYYAAYSQFSRGEYAGANQLQDDFRVIQNFLPPAPPAAGASPAAAAALAVGTDPASGGPAAVADGAVVDPATPVVYAFDAAPGSGLLSVGVTPPAAPGGPGRANLYLQVALFGPDGGLLFYSTGGGLAPTPVSLPVAGTYWLSVRGAAQEPGFAVAGCATPGFSSYGSRGRFQVNVTSYAPCVGCSTAVPAALASDAIPAPSPPPPLYLRVSRITMTTLAVSGGTSCTANVYVADAASGTAAPPGVPVLVTWQGTFAGAPAGTPTNVTVAVGSLGFAAFRSPAYSSAGGWGCAISVVAIGSYQSCLNASASALLSRNMTWGVAPSPSPSPSPALLPSPSPALELSPSPALEPSPAPALEPSPSPSPALGPSPSPSPALEPSPSPVLELSPSLVLEPSPSPGMSPSQPPTLVATQPMDISISAISRVLSGLNGRWVTCTAFVTVFALGGSPKLGGASVSVVWTTKSLSGQSQTTQTLTTGTKGSTLGIASFSSPQTSASPGSGCSFTVAAVTRSGYALSPTAVLTTAPLAW